MNPRLILTVFSVLPLAVLRSASVGEQPPRTYVNVSYGPDARNVLDFWNAPGEGQRPLLVYIHGGGWTTWMQRIHPCS